MSQNTDRRIRTGYGADSTPYTSGRLMNRGAEIPLVVQFLGHGNNLHRAGADT